MQFEVLTDACCQSASSDRGQNKVDVGQFFEDLGGHGSLSLDYFKVIERRYEDPFVLLRKCYRLGLAVVKSIAGKHDVYKIASEHFDLRDFLVRRNGRHVDHALNAEVFTGVGDALCVISRAGAYNTACAFFSGQTLNQVVGTA